MNELTTADPSSGFSAPALAPTAGAMQSQSREMAEIQTKYLMAQRFPRNEMAAFASIMRAFDRPSLAERATYEFKRGGEAITGPSIHAAQAIAMQWGNIEIGWREVSRGVGPDGVNFSECESFAVDLQSRVPSRVGFIVRHWRDTKSGGHKLRDERDIYELCANNAQRRKRACILSVIPQDVIDRAMDQAAETMKAKADTSPKAMGAMLDKFAPFGVTKEMIEAFIQRKLDAITPAQVIRLRRIWTSIDEGAKPSEWFETGDPGGSAIEAARAAAASAQAAKAQAMVLAEAIRLDNADRPQ